MSGCYKRVNFYDLCRLCAQSIQKNKTNIFEQDGQRIQLQSKITKCLSISVNQDDFLPKVVCSKCVNQLEICNAFREECISSEKMLSSYFKNYRHTQDFKRSGKVYIKDTGKSDTSESLQSCSGKIELLLKPSNTAPSSTIQFSATTPQKLEGCVKNTTQGFTLTQSVPAKKSKIDEIPPHNTASQIQTMQLPYSIDFLNEALKKAFRQKTKEILSKVVVNSNGEVVNLSPPESMTMDTLQIHSNILNGNTSVIKNRATKRHDKNILDDDVIKIDLTEDDNIQDISTNKCNSIPVVKNIQNNGQVCGQVVGQNPTVIFPVPQYQNNFTSVQTNNISYPHQTTVNIPSSTPTVINVICSNPSESNTLTTVNQNPPSSVNLEELRSTNYLSSVTSASVQSKPSIAVQGETPKKKTVVKTEDGQKIHTCEVCQKTFRRREHLYQHIKLHTGFRPYHCPECHKSFVRKEHLLRHKVLHSGERNFVCDICSKSFSRHDNLLKHIRTHNRESSYTCEVCQKVFHLKHYYEAHRSEPGRCYVQQVRVC